MELVQNGLGIVALTELGQRLHAKDIKGVVIIVGAVVVGALAGFLGLAHLSVVAGIEAGLAAVGVHTVASAASGK